MTYERIPLQARLSASQNKAFTEEAQRHDMTRAGLCRWLVDTYLSDNALGRKLRVASGRLAEKPAKVKPGPKPATPKIKPERAAAKPSRRSPKKVSVVQGRCRHGNLGLCLQCAQDRAAAEI